MAHITTNVRPTHMTFAPMGIARRIALALGAARQRRHLAQLDDAMLRDIGLSREAARAEARRPLWDVPPSWLR